MPFQTLTKPKCTQSFHFGPENLFLDLKQAPYDLFKVDDPQPDTYVESLFSMIQFILSQMSNQHGGQSPQIGTVVVFRQLFVKCHF